MRSSYWELFMRVEFLLCTTCVIFYNKGNFFKCVRRSYHLRKASVSKIETILQEKKVIFIYQTYIVL